MSLGPWADELVRVFANCAVVGDCWEWQGARSEGYGKAWTKAADKPIYIHRFVMLALGQDIDGMDVCHVCDNRPCCNPAHLFVGTRADNMQDAIKKGRFKLPPRLGWHRHLNEGRHHWQKLTAEDVIQIRTRLSAGEPVKRVAADTGMSETVIYRIKRGERWAHLP